MEKNNKLVAVAIVGMFILSGCAFGTRHVTLDYKAGVTPRLKNNIMIYVKDFRDERIDKDVVGRVRNGYGLECAKIVTNTNVSEWVTLAFKKELNNLGYTVTNYDTKYAVDGSVIEVHVTSMMMYEGKVMLEISLLKSGVELFNRKYQGTNQTLNWACTAKSYGITLEKSLQVALVEAVSDIDSKLMKEVPTRSQKTKHSDNQEVESPAEKASKPQEEAMVANYAQYYRLLYNNVSKAVVKPEGVGSGTVNVSLTLLNDGTLEDVKILESSSQKQALREAVLNAVNASKPFPPFPVDMKNESKKEFTITIEFRYH